MNCADSIKTAEYESIGKEIKKVKKTLLPNWGKGLREECLEFEKLN